MKIFAGFRNCGFVFNFYYIIMHYFEKFVIIKIKDRKILVWMSILSWKLDEVNLSYVSKQFNPVRLSCISRIYHIIMHLCEKFVRIKIKDRKILVGMSILSWKLDAVNTSYANKYSSILWHFLVFHQFAR